MLKSIYVENFALIDKLALDFDEGLNVLTGETGAGKSIIIGALSLIVGERASADYVRTSKEKALVEGLFTVSQPLSFFLKENGHDVIDDLIIKREVLANGKSNIKLNERPITQSFLREVTSFLIDIHGQHEHQSLLHSSKQIDLLDDFVEFNKSELADIYLSYQNLKKKLEKKKNDFAAQKEQEEYYAHLFNELESATLIAGEYGKIKDEKKKISKYYDIHEKILTVSKDLANGLEIINKSLIILSKISVDDQEIINISQGGEDAFSAMQAVREQLADYFNNIDFSENRLNEITERLDTLNNLKIKHLKAVPIDDDISTMLVKKMVEIKQILASITYAEDEINELDQQTSEAYLQYRSLSELLTAEREKVAKQLSDSIEQALHQMMMGKTNFEIKVTEAPESINGRDRVDFLISPNVGEPLKELAKIASGGELSRVMLAIKSVLLKKDRIPTMIFDEIDTGIGGVTAVSIAEKLKETASDHQIIVVTHLPQIAKAAEHHLFIKKYVENQETKVSVQKLTQEEKITELARMLGGATEKSLEHAQELLQD